MNTVRGCLVVVVAGAVVPVCASAYGPQGHLIAGLAAEPLLCERAAATIRGLSGGERFAELGVWADRIRGDDAWAHSAPWHYINVADGADLDALSHPLEGDVLWAIEQFSSDLADEGLSDGRRAEALKFLVHFVVDVHQPLHVGLAADRGGNEIDVRYSETTVNLHRFWDTDAIELSGLDVGDYMRRIDGPAALAAADDAGSDAWDWAGESLALRDDVYSFSRGGRLDERYIASAVEVTESRLTLAAARLANTLNDLLCY